MPIPPPEDCLFQPTLISSSVKLPDGYIFRPLQKGDFNRGFYNTLSQLTIVGDQNTQEKFDKMFEFMKSKNDEYFIVVIEEVNSGRVLGTGSVVIEHKFIRETGCIGHIEDIVVHSDYHGKGFGKLVIQQLTEISIGRGCYKTILASDRKNVGFYEKCGILPFEATFDDTEGTFSFLVRKRHSALYAAVNSFKMLHVATSGKINNLKMNNLLENESLKLNLDQLYRDKNCVSVYCDEKLFSQHYDGYCKKNLWPLFNYIIFDEATDGSKEHLQWKAYVIVNQLIADQVIKNFEDGDNIWVSDYHCLLVPQMIKKVLPNAPIAFFLHTSFPTSEIFKCLPKRKEVLEGILGADLIGFQTYSYSRHFISSCSRLLNLESTPNGIEFLGRLIDVGVFPIGIDVDRVMSFRNKPAVLDKINSIRELYPGRKIILGRDKLDHPRSVQHLLNAFERFLEDHPEWHNRVVLIQLTSPPQSDSKKIELIISQIVSRINGRFGSIEFSPHHILEEDEYFALLSVADVGLITSVRDGMNTSCSDQQENFAPLILSEFTGTANSLSTAMMVNPWDYQGVSNSLLEALLVTREEKMGKHQLLLAHVLKHTSDYWANQFITQLKKKTRVNLLLHELVPKKYQNSGYFKASSDTDSQHSRSSQQQQQQQLIRKPNIQLDTNLILQKFKGAKKRLFLFDYDGTLSPICKTPSEAVPLPRMYKALSALVDDPSNLVFIISGRDQDCLDEWLGELKGLGLSAEHGCFLKYPNELGSSVPGEWENFANDIDTSWQRRALQIFNDFTEQTLGSFVEIKKSSITWHYRLADPDYGKFQAKECYSMLEKEIKPFYPVEVLEGKKNVEVRPILINKGEIVSMILKQRGQNVDFIFCAGDDLTDEDMFRKLNELTDCTAEIFTCHVGKMDAPTSASFVLPSPVELIDLMAELESISN